MRTYRFYKNELGWFIDLKWFPFNKAWLAMIAGADTLLDKLAKGQDEVTLKIASSPIPYSDGVLIKKPDFQYTLFSGRFYNALPGYTNVDEFRVDSVWLCAVTLWVFLKYPKKIYYKIVN